MRTPGAAYYGVLPESCRRVLLAVARQEIAAALTVGNPILPPRQPELETPCGAFVSLHLAGGRMRRLRGCIGVVHSDRPLYDTVRECACAAAYRDPRFPPLTSAELASVTIEISVLSPLERITDIRLIEPGVHGILIEYGRHSGLLLPQVAKENRWTRSTFLEQTCRKAGLPPGAWADQGAELCIFQAEVFDEATLRMGS